MKKIISITGLIFIALSNIGCTKNEVDAGEEGVMIAKPYFFGHGGVLANPITAGLEWTAATTDVIRYNIKPVRYDEPFVDLTASDNVAIDFHAYITLQIQSGRTPFLHEKSGVYWYENNVQDYVRTLIRNEGRTRSSIELRTDPDKITNAEQIIKQNIKDYLESINLPVDVIKVVIGKVNPPDEVLKESERTAAQKQRVKTEAARELAEISRKKAETQSALADKAYSTEFVFTNQQFLVNKRLDIMSEKLKIMAAAINNDKINVSLIMNESNATPIFDVKK